MSVDLALSQLGLDDKGRDVYLALLELGNASMTEIATRARLKRPTAYLAVEQLQLRGLISETTRGKKRVLTPVHPRRLLEIARSRERHMEEVLPELVALYNTPKEKPKVQVYEGKEGVELVYQEVYQSLSRQEEALFFTRIDALQEYLPFAWIEYKRTMQKLNKPRVRELNYGNEAGIAWAKEFSQLYKNNPNSTLR